MAKTKSTDTWKSSCGKMSVHREKSGDIILSFSYWSGSGGVKKSEYIQFGVDKDNIEDLSKFVLKLDKG